MTAIPEKKLLTMPQLAEVLGRRLPHVPSYRKILQAIELGMPCVKSPMLSSGRLRYLFDAEECIAWWLPTAAPIRQGKADHSATDAALSVARNRRRRTG